MKFLEAMELVRQGKAVRRKNWVTSKDRYVKVDDWYAFLDLDGSVKLFSGDHCSRGYMKLTKENLETNDWEVYPNMYAVELSVLNRKYGKA